MCFVLGILQKHQSVGTVELAVSVTLGVTKRKKKKASDKRCYWEGKMEDMVISFSNTGTLDLGTEVIKMQIKTDICMEINLF